MAYTSIMLVLVGLWLVPQSCWSTTLPNLRQARYLGVSGRFPVDRGALEDIISDFNRDNFCSDDIQLSLPERLPHFDYDDRLFGEITLSDVIVQEGLPEEQGEDGASLTRRALFVQIPVMMKKTHGWLRVAKFTDHSSRVTYPDSLNNNETVLIEAIEDSWRREEPGQTVTYRMNDESVIRITVQYNAMCIEGRADEEISEDFNQVIGHPIRFMDQRGFFDWECDDVAADHEYCQKLEKYRPEIAEAGGNVCLELGPDPGRRCWAKMRVDGVTGAFLEQLPYLAGTINTPSVETAFFDESMASSITFPCIE